METPSPANPSAERRPPEPSVLFPAAPTISLGGKEWPIPLLAPRQNRVIEPRLLPLLQQIFPRFAKLQDIIASGNLQEKLKEGTIGAGDFTILDEKQYETALEIVHAALTRAHPSIRREDLLDMEGVNGRSLTMCLPTIMKSTGLFVPKPDGAREEPKPGEPESPSTGTAP